VPTVGIVGGGPGGLAAAWHLSRAGLQVSLFEAAPELGGLARSFLFGDVTIERYYHFICGSDTGYRRFLQEVGEEHRLRWEPTCMNFYYRGRLYPFSSALDLLRFDGIGVPGRVRYGLTTLFLSTIRNWRWLDRRPAVPFLRSWLGEDAYRATWHPLLSVKFPHVHERISAAWVWHRVHRVASSRKTLFHREELGHLDGGTQTLVDAIEHDLRERGVELRTATPIDRVLIDSGRAVGLITSEGEERRFDYLISAVPLPVFRRMGQDLPREYQAQLAEIDFIGVVCVTLHLERPLTDAFWVNVNDPRIPFNGFIEYTNLNRSLVDDGSSIVYVPYYLPKTHPRFRQTDDELLAEAISSLQLITPDLTMSDVMDFAVSRDPYAQVICPVGFADLVPGHRTPVARLYLIESSQLYPSDRTISGTLDLARSVAELVLEDHRHTMDSAAERDSAPGSSARQ
jgi:protoporphyrinogen oxidase